MITTLLSLSLLAAAAPAPQQANAATVHVQLADLNLRTAAGRAELDRRLQRAVLAVCPDAQSIADPRGVQQVRACRAATLASVRVERSLALAAAGKATIEVASSGR